MLALGTIAHRIGAYLQWLPNTYRLHGIHSPYVFHLQRNCLIATSDQGDVDDCSRFRESVLADGTLLDVLHQGVASTTLSNGRIPASVVAKTMGASLNRMLLLRRLSKYLQAQSILELGGNLGLGTYGLLGTKPDVQIISVEGNASFAAYAQERLDSRVKVISKRFDAFLNDDQNKYDLIYLDGHHDGQATLDYVQQLLPRLTDHGVIVLDDIHWSRDMTAGWNAIRTLPGYEVSIDCYELGMIARNPGQAREHFAIRL